MPIFDAKRRARPLSVVAAGLLVLLALLVPVAPADATVRMVVAPGDATAAEAVETLGGVVVQRLDALDLLVVDVPEARAGRLAEHHAIAAAAPDAHARLTTDGTPLPQVPKGQPNMPWEVADAIGATSFWSAGSFGRGVDVALIDTGVSQVPGLNHRGKVQYGVDLSTDAASPDLEHLDAYGHGTAMAGLIAGKSVQHTSGPRPFLGIAPGARIVSVKVGDATGEVDITQVIAGLDWVVQNRNTGGRNIRVVSLSFGLDSDSWSDFDPLSYAAEVARRNGLVVVASAGNGGPSARKLLMPAEHDGVIAVGASDMRGTPARGNDVMAPFSQGSTGDDRAADLVAPGVRIVSLRVPGSLIDLDNPHARVGDHLIRGNGTSQAAAIVAGAAALVLDRHPHLTPDQVKAYLMQTAEPIAPQDDRDGFGSVRLDRLVHLPPLHTWLPPDTSNGSTPLDQARGPGLPLTGSGDVTANGTRWFRAAWAGHTWRGTLWQGDRWNGGPWGAELASIWDQLTWYGDGWTGSRWNGREWAGSRWNGSRWNGSRWNGSRWNDVAWQVGDVGKRGWGTAWWG